MSTLWDPRDCKPPGSSVHGTLQARILEWVAISSSRDPPNPGIKPKFLTSPALAGGFFTTSATWEAQSESVSVVTLLPLGYIFHGILEARILERVAVPFSRWSSQPRDGTQVSCIAGGFFTSWATWEAHLLEG